MADETIKEVKPQSEMTFWEHGAKQMHYDAIAAPGVTPADVLERGYWAHVAAGKLRAMTKISIMADDRSWYGELIVMQTFTNGASVRFISEPVRLKPSAIIREETEFETYDGGLSKSWCVKRKKDGKNIIEGKATEAEANAELMNWLKAQGPKRAA